MRATNRLKYLKVLGSKNPADVLTKHVPAELLGRHLEATGMTATGGRAAAAPELHSVESAVFLCEEPHETKMLRFAAMVSYKAVPAVGKGRKVGQRGGREPLVFRKVEPGLKSKVAYRKLEASACSQHLEPAPDIKAKEDNMWQKIVVEAKAVKRQWADVEDSDEEARAPHVVVVKLESER